VQEGSEGFVKRVGFKPGVKESWSYVERKWKSTEKDDEAGRGESELETGVRLTGLVQEIR